MMTFTNSSKSGVTLICPRCGGGLDEVRASIHYGRFVVVDKCGVCHGVWFDKWELYSLTEEGLRSLLDSGAHEGKAVREGGNGQCPRCSIALTLFKDPGLPKDTNIQRCEVCSGAWLDSVDVKSYGKYKENVLSVKTMQFKETETEAIKEYEKRWFGKVKSAPLDRVDATPADGSGTPDGKGSVDDCATGSGDCGGGDSGGGDGSCD